MTSTTSTNGGQAMAPTLSMTKSKRLPHLWLHQTVSLEVQTTTPSILIQPSTPPVNVYKRSTASRIRSKSGEEAQSKTTKPVVGKLTDLSSKSLEERTRSTFVLPEDNIGEQKAAFANGTESGAVVVPLPSPTKRVTFLERVQRTTSGFQNHSSEGANDEKDDRRKDLPVPPARRVRKSKTLDAVMVADKSNSPRSSVMDFLNQIRTTKSGSPSTLADSASASTASGRPRSFTLGFRSFANFRLPQQHQPPERKTSRQSIRSADGKVRMNFHFIY